MSIIKRDMYDYANKTGEAWNDKEKRYTITYMLHIAHPTITHHFRRAELDIQKKILNNIDIVMNEDDFDLILMTVLFAYSFKDTTIKVIHDPTLDVEMKVVSVFKKKKTNKKKKKTNKK
jgi:hypothetical protein